MDKLERREKWNRKWNHKRNDRSKNERKNQKKLDNYEQSISYDKEFHQQDCDNRGRP